MKGADRSREQGFIFPAGSEGALRPTSEAAPALKPEYAYTFPQGDERIFFE